MPLGIPIRLPPRPRRELAASFRWPEVEAFNIGAAVDEAAARFPERVALVEPEGRQATFAEVKALSNRLANLLTALGVQRGDRVGILLGQSLECALAHLAVYKLGAIALPLSLLFGKEALEYRLEHAEARLLLADRMALEEKGPELPPGLTVVYADRIWDLMAQAAPELTPYPTQAGDPAILLYTSGTTGKPKGALLPHRTLIGHLPAFYLYSNFPGEEAVYWSPADWAWAGGLLDVLLPAWTYGYTVVAYRGRRFDPEEALALMERHQVTHTFLFPTALKLLRGLGKVTRRLHLQSVHSGGEPLGEELQEWARENLGLSINEFYGQTEANLLVGNSYQVDPIRPGSMGLPYPGHEVVLLDEEGQVLGPGQVGEVALKTPDPVAFLGYWRNEEATRAKFTGPYLRTGDLAEMDPEGYLWFKARKDDLIKSAGYRISPFEVEEALLRHPAVAMVGVVGLPDPERGQRVVAFVKLKPGIEPQESLARELQEEVRRRVGHHAYPREVRFLDELPLTPTGKIQRFKLREMA
ncbi:AMP-binding protein [Thermus oshimai]|uniref:AMP-binding protein n=1 Tax=Thermus TaxID=270 RepID=UPI0030A0BFDC